MSVSVRPEEWCITPSKNKRGRARYNARVLGFVSNDDIAAAREQAAREQAQREEMARLAAEQQAKLLEQQQANPGGGTGGDQPTETSDPTGDP